MSVHGRVVGLFYDTFTVQGYHWAVQLYPQGYNSGYSDFVSIYLKLINSTNIVEAINTHHLLDWSKSTRSTNSPANSGVNNFSTSGSTACGYHDFIRRSNIETSSYLGNDSLVIKTTLWVAKDSSLANTNSNQWNLANANVSFENS